MIPSGQHLATDQHLWCQHTARPGRALRTISRRFVRSWWDARRVESAVFDLRVLRVASDAASLVPVGCGGMREEGGEGPGWRPLLLLWLRIGGCTPPAGRLRPQAVRRGRTSSRASAIARGVGHLHESTVTGGHHDGPDNLTPLPLRSSEDAPAGRRPTRTRYRRQGSTCPAGSTTRHLLHGSLGTSSAPAVRT